MTDVRIWATINITDTIKDGHRIQSKVGRDHTVVLLKSLWLYHSN